MSYTPKVWVDGEIIYHQDLNRMEEGIQTAILNEEAQRVIDGCLYGGVVNPNDLPPQGDDHRYYYLAFQEGRYAHFNNNYVDSQVCLFYWSESLSNWLMLALWENSESLSNLFSGKADRVNSPTNGHLAGLDAEGNPTDSGIAASDVITTVDSELSSTSENPVQNKVIKSIIDALNAAKQDLLPEGSVFGGFVNPSSIPDTKYYYLTDIGGIYTYFDNTSVNDNSLTLFYYQNNSWQNAIIAPSYQFASALYDGLAGKQDTISDLATIRSGAAAGATAYQKPSTGIPKTDLASGVQTSLGKADTAVQQVTVGTTTTGNAGTNASVTNSGTATNPVLNFTIPRGADGQDGADAVNPFKGWYASANALPANPVVGDYAYVKGANASDPAAIYECTTAGTWSDSGRTADTSNVQTFASGEEVNEISIDNDFVGGADKIAGAEEVSQLDAEVNDLTIGIEVDANIVEFADGSNIFTNGTLLTSSGGKVFKISVNRGDFLRVATIRGSDYAVIARETDVQDEYDAIFQGTGSYDIPIDYICERTEDLYISVYIGSEYLIKHIKNEQRKTLIDSPWIESYTDVTPLLPVVSFSYIKFSDGSVVSSGGSPINRYTIPCDGFTKVRAFVSGRDGVSAAISFFSDINNVGTSTYLGGVQMQTNYHGGRWYEADVPANAQCVCICNNLTCITEPIVKVNRPVGLITEKIDEYLGGNRISFDYTNATIGSTYVGRRDSNISIEQGQSFKIYISGDDNDENTTYFNFYNANGTRIANTKGAGFGNRVISLTNTFGAKIARVDMVVVEVFKTATYNAVFILDGNRDLALEFNTLKEDLSWLPDYLTVPYYFENQLATKVALSRSAMLNAGKNGSTFIFITDVHWPNNEKHSPALIKHIVSELPIEDVFFGGDTFNGGALETQVGYLEDFGKKMHGASPRFFAIRGNHENNLNDGGTGFPGDYFYTLLLKYADYQVIPGEYDNYYYDNETTKTRFIVLNTGQGGDHYTAEQSAWLSSILNNMGVGFHAIILLHMAYLTASDLESDTMAPTMLAAANVADSFNAQNNGKKVEAFICGHLHNDANKATTGGIPIILTDCDARQSQSGNSQTLRTINEQAFDVITIDYSGTITCVRVGRGSDRVITY